MSLKITTHSITDLKIGIKLVFGLKKELNFTNFII